MTYVLEVEEDELRLLSAGLNEMPRKLVQPLFVKLQEQVTAQEKAAAEKAEKERKPKAEKGSKPSV